MSSQQRVTRLRWMAVGLLFVGVPAGITIAMAVNRATAQVANELNQVTAEEPGAKPVTTGKVEVELTAGRFPLVDPTTNRQARQILEAQSQPELSYRLSPVVEARPFDQASYARDRQAYLDEIEPGRVFQGPGVEAKASQIETTSPMFQRLEQGRSIVLKVSAPAGAPVTFVTLDGGAFENELGSISVAADDEGIARSVFTATTGVIAEVNILAGSPLCTGQLHFRLFVSEPARPEKPNVAE